VFPVLIGNGNKFTGAYMKITGFDAYDVNEYGLVTNTRSGRILKPEIIWDGYERVTLSQNKILKRLRVHRLVADAFIPNPNNLPMVNHKDGNKRNNHVSNLEWVDCQQNTRHAFDNNLRKSGEDHYEARLTVEIVEKICELIQIGLTRGRILKQIPQVSKSQFDDIRRRRSWKRVSYRYSW
jgi:hypothetical protein